MPDIDIAEVEHLVRERDELRNWKESAMLVESSWDVQAIAKLLGIPLGAGIRASIQPHIERVLQERDRVLQERDDLRQKLIFRPSCKV